MNASTRYVFGVGDAVKIPDPLPSTNQPLYSIAIPKTGLLNESRQLQLGPRPLLKPPEVENYTLLTSAPPTTGVPVPLPPPPATWPTPNNVTPQVQTNIIPQRVVQEASAEAREQVYAALNPPQPVQPQKTNWLVVAALALGAYYMLTD